MIVDRSLINLQSDGVNCRNRIDASVIILGCSRPSAGVIDLESIRPGRSKRVRVVDALGQHHFGESDDGLQFDLSV